jgi:hypothetical protein
LFVFASIYVYLMYKYEGVVYDVRNAYVWNISRLRTFYWQIWV